MNVIKTLDKSVNADDKVLVAVSGGPDSMALLDGLNSLRKRLGFTLAGAHLNHGLRDEAQAEQEGVEDYCRTHDIELYTREANLSDKAYRGMSVEAAGRKARYDFFAELLKAHGFTKLMTAHHLNDQAETVLMNLSRGSLTRGAIGIRPESEFAGAKIIRPFLGLSKADLIKYCQSHKVAYFNDASNDGVDYTRNAVRNRVFPVLEESIPQAQRNLTRFAAGLSLQQNFVDQILEPLLEECVKRSDLGITIEERLFTQTREFVESFGLKGLDDQSLELVKSEAVRRALELQNGLTDVTEAHILQAVKLFSANKSGRINFPRDFMAISSSGVYKIVKGTDLPEPFGSYRLSSPIASQKTYYFPKERKALTVKPGEAGKFKTPGKETGKALLRADGLKELEFRRRREGDVVFLSGMKGTKRLSRYMIDKKIPGYLRDSLPVLAQGNTVLWIPGHYIHRDFLVTSPQDSVIEVSLRDF